MVKVNMNVFFREQAEPHRDRELRCPLKATGGQSRDYQRRYTANFLKYCLASICSCPPPMTIVSDDDPLRHFYGPIEGDYVSE